MDYDNSHSHGPKEKEASPIIHQGLMDILMKLAPLPTPKADDLIEGTVLGQERSVLLWTFRLSARA